MTGLAQGRRIEGKVLFLGGPLSFNLGLRQRFIETLHLEPENAVFPELGTYFVALGAAVYADGQPEAYSYDQLRQKLLLARKSVQGKSRFFHLGLRMKRNMPSFRIATSATACRRQICRPIKAGPIWVSMWAAQPASWL